MIKIKSIVLRLNALISYYMLKTTVNLSKASLLTLCNAYCLDIKIES